MIVYEVGEHKDVVCR